MYAPPPPAKPKENQETRKWQTTVHASAWIYLAFALSSARAFAASLRLPPLSSFASALLALHRRYGIHDRSCNTAPKNCTQLSTHLFPITTCRGTGDGQELACARQSACTETGSLRHTTESRIATSMQVPERQTTDPLQLQRCCQNPTGMYVICGTCGRISIHIPVSCCDIWPETYSKVIIGVRTFNKILVVIGPHGIVLVLHGHYRKFGVIEGL
jgi:hypothetical protein